jgi:hypothetical protein
MTMTNMTTENDSLLPCPLDGGPAKTWTDGRTHHRRWRAGCPAIGCVRVAAATEKEAIAKWNTRASHPSASLVREMENAKHNDQMYHASAWDRAIAIVQRHFAKGAA